MSRHSALTRATAAPLAVVVDADLAAKVLSACEDGDIDACHLALLKLQQRHPQSVAVDDSTDTMKASERRALQPLYDLVGHGFATAASRGHVATVEFLLSSQFAVALRDGVCGDARMFPPFAALRDHELTVCVESVRFVCFAALACVDQLAMPAFQWLVETQALWDHEASLCLTLAMRRAVAAAATTTGGTVSPAAFHPMIVLLARHHAFLIDEIRAFHDKFQPQRSDGLDGLRRLDRVKALQASVLYEIVLSA